MLPLKLVCIHSSTYCDSSGYTCDCCFIWFTCSSELFAEVQFATVTLTFVKATGQSNKLLRLCSLSLSLSHAHTHTLLIYSLSHIYSFTFSLCLSPSLSHTHLLIYTDSLSLQSCFPCQLMVHWSQELTPSVCEEPRCVCVCVAGGGGGGEDNLPVHFHKGEPVDTTTKNEHSLFCTRLPTTDKANLQTVQCFS